MIVASSFACRRHSPFPWLHPVLTGASGANPNINLIAPSSNSILNFNGTAQQIITLPETGEYTIQLQSANLVGTNTYMLGLECLSPLGPVDAELVDGDLISGTTETAAQVNFYTFTGNAGDTKILTLAWLTGASGQNPRAIVYAPSGAEVLSFLGTGQQYLNLPETGQYTIDACNGSKCGWSYWFSCCSRCTAVNFQINLRARRYNSLVLLYLKYISENHRFLMYALAYKLTMYKEDTL